LILGVDMTQKKRNEIVLGKTMRGMGYYVHKFGDVRYAFCPKCKSMFPLPKAEKKPDFLIAMVYRFIEAKGAGDSWAFADDFRPNQVEFMDANDLRSWIFIEIGEGNAPAGKRSFLIPWNKWKEISAGIQSRGFKSILFKKTERSRVPCLDDITLMHPFELVWEKGTWVVPERHEWNGGEEIPF
jgi:hypothetical protein